jgi:putative transposase
VFASKYQKKLYVEIRKYLGRVFRELTRQKERKILEGYMVQDHTRMLISIPPKYSISQITRYIKGKNVVAVTGQSGGRKRNFNGAHFWVRGTLYRQ